MRLSNLKNQQGAIPVLVLLSVIGLISFLSIASIAPFRDNLLSSLFPKQSSHAALATDWPQVQKDPQRTGFSAETLGTNFKVRWVKAFQPERIYAQVQAIVYDNKVYVGTEHGNMYALNVLDGTQVWKYSTGSQILGSVAADSGKVIFGAADGAIYALNNSTGALIWKKSLSRRGFSTSPILAENKIMLGGRDGKFYALDPNTGNLLWTYDAGAPIFQTAAYNNGKAYFGSMDMYVHGVNTTNGTRAWRSDKINAMTFKDYWPVVTGGKVIVVPWGKRVQEHSAIPNARPLSGFNNALLPGTNQTDYAWLFSSNGTTTNNALIAAGNMTQIPLMLSVQDTTINNFKANPSQYFPSLYILNESDGKTGTATDPLANFVPHNEGHALNGTKAPPCVDRDGNIIWASSFIRPGWGRINLNQKRVVDVLYDGIDYDTGQPLAVGGRPMGNAATDESHGYSCSQNLFMTFHHAEGGAGFTGAFDLDTRKWSRISAGHTNTQLGNQSEAGGANPASVSNGVIFHISYNNVIARSTN